MNHDHRLAQKAKPTKDRRFPFSLRTFWEPTTYQIDSRMTKLKDFLKKHRHGASIFCFRTTFFNTKKPTRCHSSNPSAPSKAPGGLALRAPLRNGPRRGRGPSGPQVSHDPRETPEERNRSGWGGVMWEETRFSKKTWS